MQRSKRPQDNLGLAFDAARRLARRLECNPDDLVGDAYLALSEASRTFDQAKGFQFSTHAHASIHFRLFRSEMEARGYRRRLTKARGGGWEPAIPEISLGEYPDGTSRLESVRDSRPEFMASDPREADEAIAIAEEISPAAGDLMRYLLRGVPRMQAAQIVGRSRSYASMVIREVAARLNGGSIGEWKHPAGRHNPKGASPV